MVLVDQHGGLVGTPDGLDYQNGAFSLHSSFFLPGGELQEPLAIAVPKATRQKQRRKRKTQRERKQGSQNQIIPYTPGPV